MNDVHRSDHGRGVLVRALASLLLAVPMMASSLPARAVPAAGGQQLWASHFVPGDTPHSVALSPDGSTLYVTGCGGGVAGCAGSDFETAAFRASTGAVRWTATFDGPGHATDTAIAVAVSPDGSRVFVTGESSGSTGAGGGSPSGTGAGGGAATGTGSGTSGAGGGATTGTGGGAGTTGGSGGSAATGRRGTTGRSHGRRTGGPRRHPYLPRRGRTRSPAVPWFG